MAPAIAQSQANPFPQDGGWQPIEPGPTFPSPSSSDAVPATPPAPSLPGEGGWQPIEPEPAAPDDVPFALETSLLLPAGDTIAAIYRSGAPLYLDVNETRSASLSLSRPIRDSRGGIAIPAGSQIAGQFRPVVGGARFFADSVVIDGAIFPLDARSGVIAEQRDPRQVSVGAIAQDAALGAGIGLVLAAVTGDRAIATEEVLAAAAAAAVIGNVTAPNAIAIEQDTPLNLTLAQDLYWLGD